MNRPNTRIPKLSAIAGIVLLATFLALPAVLAFEGRDGDVIVIEADEVIEDDLYVGANEFTLEGTVKGDLIVGGNTITINGTVEGDLWAAGQAVTVNGTVGDDARIAGYALTVGGDVADDLLAAGFSLETKSESAIAGDLLYGGYQALLMGDVTGNAHISGAAVKIAGEIGGDANVDVSDVEAGQEMPTGFPFFPPTMPNMPPVPSVPLGLTVDDSATIGGDLNYTANTEIAIPSGTVAGDVSFTLYVPEAGVTVEAEAPSPAAIVGSWFVKHLRQLITLLLVGALMMWLVPNWTRKMSNTVRTKPLPSLGWGAVALIAFVAAMIVLVIAVIVLALVLSLVTLGELGGRVLTLGGLTAGLLGFGFSATWAYVTKIIISLLLGRLILGLFKSAAAEHRWWPMLLGVPVFVAIAAIISIPPVVACCLDALFGLIVALLGLGAIWIWGREQLTGRRAAPAGDVPLPPTEDAPTASG